MKFTVVQRIDNLGYPSNVSGLNPTNTTSHTVEADNFEAQSSVVTFYDGKNQAVAAFSNWLSVKEVRL